MSLCNNSPGVYGAAMGDCCGSRLGANTGAAHTAALATAWLRRRAVAVTVTAALAVSGCLAGADVAAARAPVRGATTVHRSPGAPPTPAQFLAYMRGGRHISAKGYRRAASRPGQRMRATPGVIEFRTPSRNISCGLTSTRVLCDVTRYSFPTPARPRTCQLNYGPSWVDLGAKRVTRGLCLSGPPFPPISRVLPYGSRLRAGAFACRSEPEFLACADLRTGRGFAVNRTTLRVYRHR